MLHFYNATSPPSLLCMDSQFRQIVISIATALQNALDEGAHSKCKALLRFIADLVNANVLLPTSLIALYDSFLAVIEEEDVPQVCVAHSVTDYHRSYSSTGAQRLLCWPGHALIAMDWQCVV